MANESKHKAAFTFIVMGIRSKNSEPRKWQKNAVSTSLIFVVIGMPSKDCKPRRWQKKVNTMQCLPSWSWNAQQGLQARREQKNAFSPIDYLHGHANAHQGL